MNACVRFVALFILLLCLGCRHGKDKKSQTRTVLPPRVDTMHFHLVDPGRQFKLYRYDSSYVIWENPNAEELKKEKKIVVDNLSIDYGKSETVEFYNYGRTYLHRTVEVPPFLPDTLCEKFELTYDIINGKYTVDYSFSPHPQDPNAPGREFYHSREAADSILHIWGAQPLNEW